MGKSRNLNGLPGNLALSYLSTLGYYNGGYMADWINFIARDKNISKINIDILNKSINPQKAQIKPLLVDLDKLQGIISQELIMNGFDNTFIRKGSLQFEIPIHSRSSKNMVYCEPILEDIDGKIYKSKNPIIETAFEVDFNPLKNTQLKTRKIKFNLVNKIRRLFK